LRGDETATLVMPSAAQLCGAHDFAAVYRTWFRAVHRWICALGGPGIDAEDLAQEVFIVVQRQLGRFDGANLPGWLYRITRLTVHDHRRRAWFRNLFLRSRDVVLDDIESPAAAPDERLDRKRCEQRLYGLVDQLKPGLRDSFLLFEIAGLTGEEIAELQGVPVPTVRTHLSRARRALATLVSRQAKGRP
jgi:RNA polymerase sigma-70 factor, ECF subfamily